MRVARRKVPEAEQFKVWVRSAGRCAICGRDLLDDSLTRRVQKLGELAHIVGQQDSAGSPRGLDKMSEAERDSAANLMLVCAGEHMEIDRNGVTDLMTVERLRKIKVDHEAWVRRVTGLEKARGTAVVRVIGDVRGSAVELSKASCAEAVISCEERFPEFPLSFDEYGLEVDLRGIPGEVRADSTYWSAASAQIDEVLSHKLVGVVRDGRVRHVSVFAFARLPLLVHLGSALDDTTPVSVYERHRRSQSWVWPATASDVAFTFESPERPVSAHEAVLVLNVSGTIQPSELPAALAHLPRYTLAPKGATPSTTLVDSPVALEAFAQVVRELFATIEAHDKHVERLHVFAALPASAAVELGRAHVPHVHPKLAIHSREDAGYCFALELK